MITKRNIVLIGSMGSGKSHFGRNLAELKGWQFVDTDRVLESRFGLSIAEIYKKIGEKAFRRAELDVLKKVCLYHEAVISVGGNFPIEHRTLKSLKRFSYIIGIRAAQYRIVSRVNRRVGKRPTMDYTNVHAFVHAMIQAWKPVYKQCDYVLDTTNGRTYDFMEVIEKELETSNVQFKARRQPKENFQPIYVKRDTYKKKANLRTNASKSNTSHYKQSSIVVLPDTNYTKKQEGEHRYGKNSSSHKRRRRARHERSYQSRHKTSSS